MFTQDGIPDGAKTQAARLYWNAFGEKLGSVMGPDEKALGFINRVLDPSHAISAVDRHGKLLGVVGFKTSKGALVGGDYSDLTAIYGQLGAVWRAGLLSLLERDLDNDRFLMDGIFVAPEARGKGVGSALLNAVMEEGRKRGYPSVRLDVIDKNPRAKALYERHGFETVKTSKLGPLKHIFKFQSAATMVKTF